VGESADITYNVKRCIHAAYCVTRLSEVFDQQKRPWINPDGVSAEQIAFVVEQCPSGALHYDRKDGIKEVVPEKNTIIVRPNGPLEIRGDLAINGATTAIEQETRVTLCRCGASKNKPFCDNSHKDSAFEAVEVVPMNQESTVPAGGKLTITAHVNGSLELQGAVEILNASGETLFRGLEVWLCRCGGSGNKPFCDGTHKRINFESES